MMNNSPDKSSTNSNKHKAVDFLQLVVSGKIDEAYEKYVNMKGRHHNAYFPAGFHALKKAMKDNHNQFPNKLFEVKHSIAENDMVATHSHLTLGEKQMTVVHLFRFDNDKITEMWDIGQEILEDIPNSDGVF